MKKTILLLIGIVLLSGNTLIGAEEATNSPPSFASPRETLQTFLDSIYKIERHEKDFAIAFEAMTPCKQEQSVMDTAVGCVFALSMSEPTALPGAESSTQPEKHTENDPDQSAQDDMESRVLAIRDRMDKTAREFGIDYRKICDEIEKLEESGNENPEDEYKILRDALKGDKKDFFCKLNAIMWELSLLQMEGDEEKERPKAIPKTEVKTVETQEFGDLAYVTFMLKAPERESSENHKMLFRKMNDKWLVASEENEPVYLFSYFTGNGEDGLHLAVSADGLNWTPLKNGASFLKSEIGKDKIMRDPSICQGPDGTFRMVWSASWTGKEFGYASSEDLIHWSEQKAIPVMAHEPTTRNTWAPEVFYDQKSETFYIFWASTIPEKFPETKGSSEEEYNHRIYYTTTKDFETFAPTRLYFDPGHNVIDAFLVQENGKYLLFYKDETLHPEAKKNILLAVGDSPAGPFTSPKVISHENWVEGPTAVKIGDKWIVYYDCYTKGRYGAVESGDLETWTDITDKIHFPKDARHGTVFRVKPEILENLTH